MEEWSSVHHIFHPRWCSNCRLVYGSVVKLGLDADWGWVPLHSAPLTFLIRGKLSRTRGGEKAIEKDTPQERCRDIQPWPEWCWSKGDVGILPVATELRCNPWTEEGSVQGVCCGAGATSLDTDGILWSLNLASQKISETRNPAKKPPITIP